MEEDGRPVLGTHIRSLSVERGRVVDLPKHVEQVLVGNLRLIIARLDHFSVSRQPGANVLVGGILRVPPE